MKSLLKLIILTTVVLFVDGAWAEEECSNEEAAVKVAQGDYDKYAGDVTKPGEPASEAKRDAKAKLTEATRLVEICRKKSTNLEERCKEYQKDYKEILKDFPYSQQIKAKHCLDSDETGSSSKMVVGIMQEISQQQTNGKKICSYNAKTLGKDAKDKTEKNIEKYEKAIRQADEDISKLIKDSQEDIQKLQEARSKLEDRFQDALSNAENDETKALAKMRDSQMQIQDAIRKAQTDLLTAKQDLNKWSYKFNEELDKQGLRTEASINRICNSQMKKYYTTEYAPKAGKKSSSNGKAIKKGAAKAKDLETFMYDCLESARDRRKKIYQDFEDYAAQLANRVQSIEAQIASLESQYKQQVTDYNTRIQKNQSDLTKDQQRYFKEDSMIADKILKAQQNLQREQARLEYNKRRDSSQLTKEYTSQGNISEEEANEILDKNDELERIYNSAENCAWRIDLVNSGEKSPRKKIDEDIDRADR